MKRTATARLFGRLLLVVGVVTLAATVLAMGAFAAAPPGPYANGFESADDVGTLGVATDQAMFNATRVTTGTNGITSASGSYHALAPVASDEVNTFTRYGGYTPTFPAGGYTTSVDIYLNATASSGFDWSTSTSDATGGYDRDFVFNVGPDGNGHFVVSASNNAGVNPANPDRSPYTITTSGWYTFKHEFTNVGGVLAAELTIRPLGAATLSTWTLSDPSDTIATVGGNRYGWLLNNTQPIALDNITRSDVPTCKTVVTSMGTLTAAVVDPDPNYAGPLPLSGCQIGVYFDKAGSVTNADIAGATHYGVFADKGAKVEVTDSKIHQIGNSPFNGAQNGRAVFYANGATGTVSGNTITDYQKNGVHVTGAGTSVKVQKNTVTGRGQIGTIAQNGIVVVSGAFAQVWDNTVSRNYYTGAETYATGILVIDATVNMTKKNVVTLNGVNIDIAGTIVGKKSSA